MQSLQEFLDGADSASRNEFSRSLEAWANEVLRIRADTSEQDYDPFERSVILDDLVGAYVVRDRLERLGDAADMLPVRAVDELLLAITRAAGRDWLEMTGLADLASRGWWWSRMPVASPASDARDPR